MPLPASPHKMNTESSSTLLTELEQQADEFMALVKSTLLGKNQPQRYTKFLSLLEEPRLKNISHIMHLLDGHESLIMHFNWFVSPKFRVSPVDLKRKLYQRSARTTRSNESIIAAGESMEQHQHPQEPSTTSTNDAGATTKLSNTETKKQADQNAPNVGQSHSEDDRSMVHAATTEISRQAENGNDSRDPANTPVDSCSRILNNKSTTARCNKRSLGSNDEMHLSAPKAKRVRFVSTTI